MGHKESYMWYSLCDRIPNDKHCRSVYYYKALGPKESYQWYEKGVYLHCPMGTKTKKTKKTAYQVYRTIMTGKGWNQSKILAHWHTIKKTANVRPYQRLADAYNEEYSL